MGIAIRWNGSGEAPHEFQPFFCCDVCGSAVSSIEAAAYVFSTAHRAGTSAVFVACRGECLHRVAVTMEQNGGRPAWLNLDLLPAQLLANSNPDSDVEYVLAKRPRESPLS